MRSTVVKPNPTISEQLVSGYQGGASVALPAEPVRNAAAGAPSGPAKLDCGFPLHEMRCWRWNSGPCTCQASALPLSYTLAWSSEPLLSQSPAPRIYGATQTPASLLAGSHCKYEEGSQRTFWRTPLRSRAEAGQHTEEEGLFPHPCRTEPAICIPQSLYLHNWLQDLEQTMSFMRTGLCLLLYCRIARVQWCLASSRPSARETTVFYASRMTQKRSHTGYLLWSPIFTVYTALGPPSVLWISMHAKFSDFPLCLCIHLLNDVWGIFSFCLS
ncbi:PREDICTED: uncharacterized protein LOC106147199 [Chinchilla lanigera]|uniref:uncharacterized protein LOC106147199 n=1 Tax=Chinchilla lanigera TaxID=34839 RepID=UPI0006970D92|nr:PREDICTED: uncharacterized protein LOC106147199 [Chinchilla lanigera]